MFHDRIKVCGTFHGKRPLVVPIKNASKKQPPKRKNDEPENSRKQRLKKHASETDLSENYTYICIWTFRQRICYEKSPYETES